ncbi:sulfoquinovosidase isoform X1 [Patella vulgata]|uniref:sulfoquinovosidase isoform X1 n=2 Tax=Patella vulgata TaxID=6465 RepID=UPI002180393E|nr:sulfoquinovosidase isoform X1 [Patella vulgata]
MVTDRIIMRILVYIILSVLTAQEVKSKDYTFQMGTDGAFTVWINNVKVIDHTKEKPFLYAGRGTTDFEEDRGNFDIRDYVLQRLDLKLISRTEPTDGDDLTMAFDNTSSPLVVKLRSEEDHSLTIDISDIENAGYDRVWIRIAADKDEEVYGGGEQFSYLNLRGRPYPIWTREQGVGRNQSTLVTFMANQMQHSGGDYHTTYFPQPTFYSRKKYYFHHGSSNYAVLDFSRDDAHEVFILGQPGRIYINRGNSFTDLVQKLTTLLGRMPELPNWIYDGAIIGVQGGSQKMAEYIDYCDQYKINLAGVWIQDWAGTKKTSFGKRLFWNWRWNDTLYPGLNETILTLKERGIKVLAYINPYLNQDGDIFKIADARGYFMKNKTGQTFIKDFGEFHCGTIDLTNPEAYDWYKNEVVKKNMIDLGLGGWMADFGEYLPIDGYFYNNKSAQMVHNEWPVLWAKLNREAVEETDNLGKIVYWMRAGFTGTGNYSTLMWAGDQDVDFTYADGLASTIPSALNMGLSGVGITHFDIGGYTTFAPKLVRSAELLLRSAEAAAFGPVFRSHEGNQPTANVQFYSSHEVSMKYARLCNMFIMLKNYSVHVIKTTADTGIPAQRPLFMQFQDDPGSYDATYQFMYGDDLLVAPVFKSGVTAWNVYLPNDTVANAKWVNIWNPEEMYEGPMNVQVAAPLGKTPVFYRSTSMYADIFKQIGSTPLIVVPTDTPHPNPTGSMNFITASIITCLLASLICIIFSWV